MLWKRNIQDQVDDWTSHDRSPLYLLSGARVAEARRWLAASAEEFSGPDAEFIKASIMAEDDRVAQEDAKRKRLQRLTLGLAVATVISLIAFWYAYQERGDAITQRDA